MCDEEKSESKAPNAVNVAGRIAGMALAVASAALMATASQCAVYQYGASAHTVTYSDFGPFVYLVVANAIAAFLGAIAIFLSVWKKAADAKSKVLLPFLDAAVPALLYSSIGAAFAAGDMTYCSAYGRRVSVCAGGTSNFCSKVHTAIYISLAAAFAVSAAEVAKNVPLSLSLVKFVSDSGSESGCEQGCHHNH